MVTVDQTRAETGVSARTALAIMRLTLGALFVWVFFENWGKGLYTAKGYTDLINYYLDKGQAPAIWKSVMAMAAANASIAAPLQAVTEIGFGVLLLLGLLTRPVALAAGGFLFSLWVSEWGTAWIWELLVPIMVAFAVSLGSAGRTLGLDSLLARRYPRSRLF